MFRNKLDQAGFNNEECHFQQMHPQKYQARHFGRNRGFGLTSPPPPQFHETDLSICPSRGTTKARQRRSREVSVPFYFLAKSLAFLSGLMKNPLGKKLKSYHPSNMHQRSAPCRCRRGSGAGGQVLAARPSPQRGERDRCPARGKTHEGHGASFPIASLTRLNPKDSDFFEGHISGRGSQLRGDARQHVSNLLQTKKQETQALFS